MRRNYGSLNLAALDLSSSSSSATIDDARYQESFMLAHDLAHLDVSSEHDDCASAVGYPIEYFAMMHDGDSDHYSDAYARADSPRCRKRSLSEHGLGAETRASSSASITSTCSTVSTSSNTSSVSTGISIPVSVATAVKASSSSLQSSSYNHHHAIQKQHNLALDLPPRLVEQHHMELNALRCLSLNLMLSSSTPSGGSSGMMTMPQPSTSVPKVNSFEFEIGCQPQTDRVTTALLAGRRSSLPRNMIQSV